MKDAKTGFTGGGFFRTFVLPGLFVFLTPVAGLLFFLHAQNHFDSQSRDAVLEQIRADAGLTPEERENATAFFTEHPFSELIKNEVFANQIDSTALFHYATFRWMIRLSAASLLAGVVVFLLAGLCVAISMRSNRVQYLSLSVGWHVLRAFAPCRY